MRREIDQLEKINVSGRDGLTWILKIQAFRYELKFDLGKVYGWVFLNAVIRVVREVGYFNRLMPNDPYRCRTASLTSKRCILYIYSTNIGTEYFKHGVYSPFIPLQNSVFFIILTYLVPVLFTFYIQGVLKLKKNNSGAKRLVSRASGYLLERKMINLVRLLDNVRPKVKFSALNYLFIV